MIGYLYPDSDMLGEPAIEDVLADPIVQLVMQRDGVDEGDMRGQIERVKQFYNHLIKKQ